MNQLAICSIQMRELFSPGTSGDSSEILAFEVTAAAWGEWIRSRAFPIEPESGGELLRIENGRPL
jgi:hypothetical protein